MTGGNHVIQYTRARMKYGRNNGEWITKSKKRITRPKINGNMYQNFIVCLEGARIFFRCEEPDQQYEGNLY